MKVIFINFTFRKFNYFRIIFKNVHEKCLESPPSHVENSTSANSARISAISGSREATNEWNKWCSRKWASTITERIQYKFFVQFSIFFKSMSQFFRGNLKIN